LQHSTCCELGNRAEEGIALGTLGCTFFRLGQYDKAIEFRNKQLSISRELKDRAMEGQALGRLGDAFTKLGQYDKAIEVYNTSLSICRELGDKVGEERTIQICTLRSARRFVY